MSTYAGTGIRGYADGPALSAQFNSPNGLVADAAGNLYVLDRDNPRVRRIDAAGNVTTIAGTGTAGYADGPAAQAQFNLPYGLGLSPNGQELYVADAGNHRIRKISLGPLTMKQEQAGSGMEMQVFPNPAVDAIRLTATVSTGTAAHLVLLDVMGRTVAMPSLTTQPSPALREWQLNVSHLPAGVYLCRLAGEKFTLTQRLLVKH